MSPAQFTVRVIENQALSGGYFRLYFDAARSPDLGAVTAGEFVMLRGDWGRDLINGRAFSILAVQRPNRFSILGKVFGRGTVRMAAMRPGDEMSCTGPLGQGFAPPSSEQTQLLVAGGVGLPPLLFQASHAARLGLTGQAEMFYGGRTRDDLVLLEDIEASGVGLTLTTEDGSHGEAGRVTTPLLRRLDQAAVAKERVVVLACGPTPMLRAVRDIGLARNVPTQISLEEHMACGYGVCLGCAVPVHGPKPYKYCCTDGPVFAGDEVRWS